jgi:putative ABC transport system permease protein
MIVVGLAVLGYALFGGASSVILYGGLAVGALLIFLGVAAVSPSFATPVARTLGAPFAGIWREPGKLARENAARNPRRTSSTAAALMIGLALVTMALIVGNSVKTTFIDALGSSVRADWYIDTGSFFPFSPEVAASINSLDEIGEVSQLRFGNMAIDDEARSFNAVDYDTLEDMFDIGLIGGSVSGDEPGLLINEDPATDLGLEVGDTVEVTFNQTGTVGLSVRGIYEKSAVLGNWILDLETYDDNFTEQLDFAVTATTAEGVSPGAARAAIERITEVYPELRVLDAEEYQDANEEQLDQLLFIINLFLGMTIVIAFIGIVNTLALSVFERTRELGLLRAVGMTNRQVRRMIRLEAVVVAVFGAVLGVVVGVVFGSAVTVALPDDFADGITYPIWSMLMLLVLAALLGVIAAIWPAIRASRLDLLRAIGFE